MRVCNEEETDCGRMKMQTCPNCGEVNKESSRFCRECGYKLINEDKKDYNPYEEYNPAYGRLTNFAAKKLDNSKLVDKLIDVSTPNVSNFHENDVVNKYGRKYLESLEKEFLEVYDSIDDGYLKALFMLERNKIGGGGNIRSTIV